MHNLRPFLYGQQLAWQIIFDYTINPSNGVEPIPKVIFDKFKTNIIIKCKKKALEGARKAQPDLVLCTYRLKLDHDQAAATFYWENNFTSC